MIPVSAQVQEVLRDYLSDILARSILSLSLNKTKVDLKRQRPGDGARLLEELGLGVRTYVGEAQKYEECVRRLAAVLGTNSEGEAPPTPALAVTDRASSGTQRVSSSPPRGDASEGTPKSGTIRVEVVCENDIVRARGAGRELAREIGFSGAMQIKLATAISELARNIVQYAGTGTISIRRLPGNRRGVEVVANDNGPGIANIDLVMSDAYKSRTGMGIGLKGTKRMMDVFDLDSAVGKGTRILLRKYVA